MSLSKKHFIRIAEIIKSIFDSAEGEGIELLREDIVSQLAGYFREENPLFDDKKFSEACGVKQ